MNKKGILILVISVVAVVIISALLIGMPFVASTTFPAMWNIRSQEVTKTRRKDNKKIFVFIMVI